VKDGAMIEGRRKGVFLHLHFFYIVLAGLIILSASVCW